MGAKRWAGYREAVAALAGELAALGHHPVVATVEPDEAEWLAQRVGIPVEKYGRRRGFRHPIQLRTLAESESLSWARCREMGEMAARLMPTGWTLENVGPVIYGNLVEALLLLYRHTPDCVVLYNPYRPVRRPLLRASEELGVSVLYFEKGMLPASFQLDHAGINGGSSFAAETDVWSFEPQRVAQQLEEVREELFGGGKTGWDQGTGPVGPDELRRQLGLPAGRRVLLYVGQLNRDSNLVAFSPHFATNADALRFVSETLSDQPDWVILGKKHPKGEDDDSALQGLLGERGLWTGDVHLHDCLDLADCVVSINSSVVLEALLKHKPVVLLGRGVFSGKGVAFEYEGTNQEELREALAEAPLDPFGQEEVIDYWCWRAACRWLYRCRPEDLPGEARRAAEYVLKRGQRGKAPPPERVVDLLASLADAAKRDAASTRTQLRKYRGSYEHIMGKWPVRAYRAVKKVVVDLAGSRQRTGATSRLCHGPGEPLTTAAGHEMAVCVAKARPYPEFETFVRAHIDHLPARVTVLCGNQVNETPEGGLLSGWEWRQRVGKVAQYALGWRLDKRLAHRRRASYLRREDVSVVLAEFGHTGAKLQDACAVADIPLVVHFHGYDAYSTAILEKYGASYRRMFSTCAAVVAVSEDMKRQLLRLGVPAEKLVLNSYGVDCERFAGARPGSAPPAFVAVGRFVEKKGPHLTLLAFRKVLQSCPEARLRMVGDGPLLAVCRDIVKGADLAGSVELPGALSHAEVAECLRSARAFVQHSVRSSTGDSEGTPVAVLEACAAGLPVVATRHAGITEAVIDGTTGFLVEERAVDSMAERMIELARAPRLADRLGRAGREHMRAHYTIDQNISGLWQILCDAAHGVAAGRR
jgi:glycosyltransferase involved in cell wall biosynthesis